MVLLKQHRPKREVDKKHAIKRKCIRKGKVENYKEKVIWKIKVWLDLPKSHIFTIFPEGKERQGKERQEKPKQEDPLSALLCFKDHHYKGRMDWFYNHTLPYPSLCQNSE